MKFRNFSLTTLFSRTHCREKSRGECRPNICVQHFYAVESVFLASQHRVVWRKSVKIVCFHSVPSHRCLPLHDVVGKNANKRKRVTYSLRRRISTEIGSEAVCFSIQRSFQPNRTMMKSPRQSRYGVVDEFATCLLVEQCGPSISCSTKSNLYAKAGSS